MVGSRSPKWVIFGGDVYIPSKNGPLGGVYIPKKFFPLIYISSPKWAILNGDVNIPIKNAQLGGMYTHSSWLFLACVGLWPQYITNHGMHACGPGTCEVMECMRTCILCHCFGAPWKHVGMVAVGEGIVHMLCPTQYMDTRKSTH